MVEDPIATTGYDPIWPAEFKRITADIQKALDTAAVGVDHAWGLPLV
ncbi:MAG: hypothetical protein JRM80_12320 [Nitrososphaerota archaeon]|nr:hypothetical protein [Nitrososphaerota archaeon]